MMFRFTVLTLFFVISGRLEGSEISGVCGGGNVDSVEECDDGRCGDGILRRNLVQGDAGYETCDDNNLIDEGAQINSGDTSPFVATTTQTVQNASPEELNRLSSNADRSFAGMGLFGDYALFFGAASLATVDNFNGLHLERIEDIILRIEFVSARPQP